MIGEAILAIKALDTAFVTVQGLIAKKKDVEDIELTSDVIIQQNNLIYNLTLRTTVNVYRTLYKYEIRWY